MENTNFAYCQMKPGLFNTPFLVVDFIEDPQVERVLEKHNVPARYTSMASHPDFPQTCLRFFKVKNKYVEAFKEAIEDLYNWAVICNKEEYLRQCEHVQKMFTEMP